MISRIVSDKMDKMKTLVLGDTHGRSLWKLIVYNEKPDRVIFIGDYFDSFDISGLDQIQNFKEIVDFKERGECEVILLIGNHDFHYMEGVDENYSGYQSGLAPSIGFMLKDNSRHLQMAYRMGQYLFTHAGVSSTFMDDAFGEGNWKEENIADDINELFKYKPLSFGFGVYCDPHRFTDPHGDSIHQSPIWIRPRSLMNSNYDTLRKKIIQVVGHTQVNKVDADGKADGNRYWFIDCLGTSGQYLVIEGETVNVNKI